MALVLALGALLRIACEIAYRPALFYSDSWGYLSMAHGGGIVSFAPLRPSGYPLILKVLHWLTLTTVVQHLAGLAVATLAYPTPRSLGVGRWGAPAAGAFVGAGAPGGPGRGAHSGRWTPGRSRSSSTPSGGRSWGGR